MDIASEFRSKVLTRSKTAEDYLVYRAGLEWDLADPIVIESSDDFRSKQKWRDRLEPFQHQVRNLITFCRRLPVTLLADDVGLGKTISAGLVMSELAARARVSKILIVCPKILGPQWKEELETKFGIESQIAVGKTLVDAEPDGVGAVITTYNSARMYLERIPEDRFQMLILDEAHKLRNLYGTQTAPQVALKFRQALEDRRFRYVLMLTATPIQNRLWDLYSLVDLLTVARGHPNPFGSQGLFARKFVEDHKKGSRKLKLEAQDEFRSIVYSYMSRVRRDDAKLYFPDRKIHREHSDPTKAEFAIIQTIAGPIQKLNKLVQIGILQALVSSPEALLAQLQNMARKGSIPIELATDVASIVKSMPPSTKLAALGRLIKRLQQENADNWRVVIFTGRRETQTTIQIFLESLGINVGIINGSTGGQNSDTIAKFRFKPPKIQAIVSTEAGAEGVNLQVANVLVNYDLPWNPMIVEQRIGRVQRLASDHAHVSIYNVTLRGTFEEYIVGRLMEKLQMASHAVGDVEALLQSSGISDDDGDSSFEDKILELVLASLAGKDHEKTTQLTIKSIDEAKQELEREEANINEMLGSMDGHEYTGPRLPKLPDTPRSMTSKEFTLRGLKWLGASLTPYSEDIFVAEEDHSREYIRLSEQTPSNIRTTLYSPGSPAFERLVSRIVASGVHDVDDLDVEPERVSGAIVEKWAKDFGGADVEVTFDEATRSFSGTALLRVRATVAHDSYERLIEVSCAAGDHQKTAKGRQLMGLPRLIEDPAIAGIDIDRLVAAANIDEHISEFTRFYLERRAEEMNAAKNDERKRKKLEDEFTPRLEIELVGLKGEVRKEIKLRTSYRISGTQYHSALKLVPSNRKLTAAPEFGLCSKSGATIPIDCIGECSVTGAAALKHLLVKSDVSSRYALSEFTVTCSVTGKRALNDEVLLSDLTGNPVIAAELRTSAISGKRAEPVHFVECAFTKATLLRSEVAISELSDKPYRIDQQMKSSVSGRSGHKSEFIFCHETRQPIAPNEAERCEVTNHRVRSGVLQTCQATGKKTLPSELERCAATDKLVIRSRLVKSSESQSRCIDTVAIKSLSGRVCLPAEAVTCFWSGKDGHPDDVMECRLTGLNVHSEYATKEGAFRLRPLVEMLDGLRRNQEQIEFWPDVAANLASSNGGKHRIEAAIVSPSKRYLATCSEQKSFLGMRSNSVGAIYDLTDRAVLGQVAVGKRNNGRWVAS